MSMLIVAKAKLKEQPTKDDPVTREARRVPSPLVTDEARVEVTLRMPLPVAETLRGVLDLAVGGNTLRRPGNRRNHMLDLKYALYTLGVFPANTYTAIDGRCCIGITAEGFVFLDQPTEEFNKTNSPYIVITND